MFKIGKHLNLDFPMFLKVHPLMLPLCQGPVSRLHCHVPQFNVFDNNHERLEGSKNEWGGERRARLPS